MKKICAFLLVAMMLVGAFVVTSSAAKVNEAITVNYTGVAPKQDGVINPGEYGGVIVDYDPAYKDQIDGVLHDHDKYDNWGFKFYAAWDFDYLYLAWVAETEIHAELPADIANDPGKGLGYMWEYSCTQFIITPSEPQNGVTGFQNGDYAGNYMEGGVALVDGETQKVLWNTFTLDNGQKAQVTTSDWDAFAVRNDAAKTTTYEVRLPWAKSGVTTVGNDQKFGLTFAVAAQEQYTNVQPGMLEWQDGILGGKNADAAGVITLAGYKDTTVIKVDPGLPTGTLPAEVTDDSVKLVLDSVDKGITENASTVITDPANHTNFNTTYTGLLLLAPVEGEENTYYLVEKKAGTTGEPIVLESEITEGMIAAAFHGDGEGTEASDRKAAALAIEEGTRLHLFGIDLAGKKAEYTNAMLYTVAGEEPYDPNGGDTSEPVESSEVPVESSEEPVESSEAPSEEPSAAESVVESSAESKEESKDESTGLGTGAIIGIVAAVVAVIGAAVAVVLKKKKK